MIVAVVTHAGLPVTPDVASVWPFTKPEIVAVSCAFAWPNGRLFASAVTVRVGSPTGGGTMTAPTVKLWVTCGAAAQVVPLPAWLALIVHVPTARNETTARLIEHTALAAASIVKMTGWPDPPPVAVTV